MANGSEKTDFLKDAPLWVRMLAQVGTNWGLGSVLCVVFIAIGYYTLQPLFASHQVFLQETAATQKELVRTQEEMVKEVADSQKALTSSVEKMDESVSKLNHSVDRLSEASDETLIFQRGVSENHAQALEDHRQIMEGQKRSCSDIITAIESISDGGS